MPTAREQLAALQDAARERGLTPVSWWIGAQHHDRVLDELETLEAVDVETEGGRLRSIEGLEVKLLTETPDRLALWCEEGALDL